MGPLLYWSPWGLPTPEKHRRSWYFARFLCYTKGKIAQLWTVQDVYCHHKSDHSKDEVRWLHYQDTLQLSSERQVFYKNANVERRNKKRTWAEKALRWVESENVSTSMPRKTNNAEYCILSGWPESEWGPCPEVYACRTGLCVITESPNRFTALTQSLSSHRLHVPATSWEPAGGKEAGCTGQARWAGRLIPNPRRCLGRHHSALFTFVCLIFSIIKGFPKVRDQIKAFNI